MYQTPNLKVDVSVAKVLVICITIFASLILPIQLHQYFTTQPVNAANNISVTTQTPVANVVDSGRVAGESTVRSTTVDFLGIEIDKTSAPYFIGGFLLLGLSLLIITYLILESNKNKQLERDFSYLNERN